MIEKYLKRSLITALFCLGSISVFGQAESAKPSGPQRPLLQDITVYKEPVAAPAPLVKKTGSSTPRLNSAALSSGKAARSSFPILADAAIPGTSGVLVETLDGGVIVESGSDIPLNPASNVKIAAAYAVLKTFGPNYRFSTSVWTDGSYDKASKTIYGNVYVTGRDPIFAYEHAVSLANELNRMGIEVINGDLVVADSFAMNHSSSAQSSSHSLFASLDSAKRPAAATRAWTNHLINTGKLPQNEGIPSVSFNGKVYVQPMPSNAKLLVTHESAPMREIVKVTMCYSNNFIAERLGDMVGGPYGVANMVRQSTGVQPHEFSIQTSSGLGINRVTASAMMKLLRVFRSELGRHNMTFADIMPVAGMDKGTLENRFDSDFSMGSVIGKTGTLGRTDGGVSALAGEINTRNGTLLFVIFNQRGSVARFRSFQNHYVSLIQGQLGGASPITYRAKSLDSRLANTRFSYPGGETAGSE